MAQKLHSDIEAKGPGSIKSPDELQDVIDSTNEVVSGMSGEVPIVKHINMLLCELKVLVSVLHVIGGVTGLLHSS